MSESEELLNIPLSKTEEIFKDAASHSRARHLELPLEREDVMDILQRAALYNPDIAKQSFIKDMDELAFIEENLDVIFFRQYRYMPAFRHTHDFFSMLYQRQGTSDIYVGEARHLVMAPGDLLILAPGMVHAVSAFHDEDIVYDAVIRESTFDESFIRLLDDDQILAGFFRHALYRTGEKPYLLFHTRHDEKLQELFGYAIGEMVTRRRYKKQMLNNILSAIFITLIRGHEKDLDMPMLLSDNADENILYIIHYMQSHYSTVTLTELASFFNYSERQMQRIISGATGMTFMQNIQQQKMSKAKELITETGLGMDEICEIIGFHSVNHFRRIFKRTFGMNPGEYRELHKVNLTGD